jgi:hypothetical protein
MQFIAVLETRPRISKYKQSYLLYMLFIRRDFSITDRSDRLIQQCLGK